MFLLTKFLVYPKILNLAYSKTSDVQLCQHYHSIYNLDYQLFSIYVGCNCSLLLYLIFYIGMCEGMNQVQFCVQG